MKYIAPVVILLCLASIGGYAQGQTATARMAECLIASTTGADRVALARWVGFAVIAHPSIRESVAIPKQVVDSSDVETAELITQLMTVRCLKETRNAAKENDSSIEDAFKVLGQVAMQEIMMDGSVDARIGAFIEYIDESSFSVFH